MKKIIVNDVYVLKDNPNPTVFNIAVQNIALNNKTGEEMVVYSIYHHGKLEKLLWCEKKKEFLEKYIHA